MSGTRLAVELARWAIGFLLLWRMPRLPAGAPSLASAATGAVSVVVPARNEAVNLARLLPSVVGVRPGVEVIVVDDGSSDATAAVAAAHGATVIDAGEPPAGWTGKAWACSRGAAAARGDVLVFVDADVVVEAGGLDRVLAAKAGQRSGIVSAQPWHAVERPYEALSAFANLVSVMGTGAFTIFGRRVRGRGAFGPCLAIDRAGYEDIGGHGAVRSAVAEDVALAGRSDDVRLFAGAGALRYRMYSDGLGALIRGWTKNLATGATAANPLVVLLVVAWVSGLLQAPLTAPWLYGLYAVQLVVLWRSIGRFGVITAALYPIPLAFFVVVFGWSAVRTVGGGTVDWRGRRVRVR